MAETPNPHYQQVIMSLSEGKDSIFEPCRVMSFDPKTLMATIRGIRSKAVKKNVIVLFPSMFMNTGIISFPVKESVGLSFLGVDNEVYLLPGQFMPPVKETKNASVSSNASPGQFDELLSFENMEPGEHLIRSLGGAQIYVKNTGEIEMSNSKMHRISLDELEGAMEVVVERKREYIGYSETFNGVHDPNFSDDSTDHHIFSTYFEKTPNWETDEVLPADVVRKLMKGELLTVDGFSLAPEAPIANMQMVNVFNEDDSKKISEVDGSELFYEFNLTNTEWASLENNDGIEVPGRFKIKLSKGGVLQTESSSADDNQKVTVTQGNGFYKTELENKTTGKKTAIKLTIDGEVEVTDSSGSYTLSSIIDRLNALEGN